jgi:hypothetical protein
LRHKFLWMYFEEWHLKVKKRTLVKKWITSSDVFFTVFNKAYRQIHELRFNNSQGPITGSSIVQWLHVKHWGSALSYLCSIICQHLKPSIALVFQGLFCTLFCFHSKATNENNYIINIQFLEIKVNRLHWSEHWYSVLLFNYPKNQQF